MKTMNNAEMMEVNGGTKWHVCNNCGSAYLTKVAYGLHVLFNKKRLGCTWSNYFTVNR